MSMLRRLYSIALPLALFAARVHADTLATPIAAEVYVKGPDKATALRGKLTSFDERQFTLHVGSEDVTMAWGDVTATSAFALRQKTIDRKDAHNWLDLGKFAWGLNLKDQAKVAFKQATRLDTSLQGEVDTALSAPAGSLATAATRPAKDELMTTGPGPTPKTPAKGNKTASASPVKYQPVTPEEAAAAMTAYRQQADEIQKKFNAHYADFETDHFLVFTNWDKREYAFLKENLENAYKVVAQQFDMSPKDNIFVGKLPVYMLVSYDEFQQFASQIDDFKVNKRTAGYYFGNNQGIGHMAMWKPDSSLTGTNNLHDAERLWAYVLVHEFTHAFLARYRSNEFIPRWLNEGAAEVIAVNQFPYPDRARMARMMAIESADLMFLFDSHNVPTGEYYPVMQSMVEMLLSMNKGNFVKLIDAIKDGEDTEAALQRLYHVNFPQFASAWREWAKRR